MMAEWLRLFTEANSVVRCDMVWNHTVLDSQVSVHIKLQVGGRIVGSRFNSGLGWHPKNRFGQSPPPESAKKFSKSQLQIRSKS